MSVGRTSMKSFSRMLLRVSHSLWCRAWKSCSCRVETKYGTTRATPIMSVTTSFSERQQISLFLLMLLVTYLTIDWLIDYSCVFRSKNRLVKVALTEMFFPRSHSFDFHKICQQWVTLVGVSFWKQKGFVFVHFCSGRRIIEFFWHNRSSCSV